MVLDSFLSKTPWSICFGLILTGQLTTTKLLSIAFVAWLELFTYLFKMSACLGYLRKIIKVLGHRPSIYCGEAPSQPLPTRVTPTITSPPKWPPHLALMSQLSALSTLNFPHFRGKLITVAPPRLLFFLPRSPKHFSPSGESITVTCGPNNKKQLCVGEPENTKENTGTDTKSRKESGKSWHCQGLYSGYALK